MFPQQSQGGENIQVVPKDPEVGKPKQRPMIRVYFIGYKTLRNGKPPFYNIRGRGIQMPPIGEYLDLPDIIAYEVGYRSVWQEKGKTPLPGVTTSLDTAKAVQAAYLAGNIDSLNIRDMVAAQALTQVSEETLINELRARGVDMGALLQKEAAVKGSKSAKEKTE